MFPQKATKNICIRPLLLFDGHKCAAFCPTGKGIRFGRTGYIGECISGIQCMHICLRTDRWVRMPSKKNTWLSESHVAVRNTKIYDPPGSVFVAHFARVNWFKISDSETKRPRDEYRRQFSVFASSRETQFSLSASSSLAEIMKIFYLTWTKMKMNFHGVASHKMCTIFLNNVF